ncbi:RidA family protein [Alsobacter sp. SYSU M60028]|uniref:RidA family protein n=1 Tax=Alsobacter ponti TaxID=2962936 RepID=A0ABT1LBP5_9HYPH|nr:RidA family protein [Alsobacter ponti]MCP8938859.1 RidA family protein [Alsobacter ponti]
MTPEEKLAQLGLTLPPPPSPMANYVPIRRDGATVYLAGQGPRLPDGSMRTGKVGADVDVRRAYDDARLVGLQLLALMKEAAGGDLSKVEVLKLLGMVNATPEFDRHPEVINGCSDLLVEVLGDAGRHARSAVGMGSLPRNITVEVEAIIRIRD